MTTVLLMRHGEIQHRAPALRGPARPAPHRTRPGAGAWCSDLARCRETATPALADCELSATPLPDLRELCLGAWEGLPVDDVRGRFSDEYRGAAPTWRMWPRPAARASGRCRSGRGLRCKAFWQGTAACCSLWPTPG
ncbi:MAG: histidine phosphatase family protein [Desulfovibrio sp.]|nr:histidine phosphatase family protein [Desulfovibrio sp.]